MAHTLGTLEQTRASTENMEFWISTCTSADLLAGLRRMGQGAAKGSAAPASRVAGRRRIIVNDDSDAVFNEESRSPEAFLAKRSNLQLAVGGLFSYRRSRVIGSPKAIDLFAKSWVACRPLLDAALKPRG